MRKRKYNKEFEGFKNQTKSAIKIMDRVTSSLDDETTIDISKRFSEEARNSLLKECFHYDKSKCSNQIIKAHSIQRKNRLFLLEDNVNGNKLLYSLKGINYFSETNKFNKPTIGKLSASTFSGFCSFHDKTIFSPIEDFDFNESEEHLFLHSYRSYAYSYHRIMEDKGNLAEPFIDMVNRREVETYEKAKTASVAMQNIDNHRIEYNNHVKYVINKMLQNKEYSKLKYFVFYIGGKCSVASATARLPNYTYLGKPLRNFTGRMPLLLTVLPDKKESFVILAAFEWDKAGLTFLEELEKLTDKQVEKAISSLMLLSIDGNVFFAPAFWEGLGESRRKTLIEEYMTISVGFVAITNFYRSSINFFDEKYLAANLGF